MEILASETVFHKVNLKFCSFMSIDINFTNNFGEKLRFSYNLLEKSKCIILQSAFKCETSVSNVHL